MEPGVDLRRRALTAIRHMASGLIGASILWCMPPRAQEATIDDLVSFSLEELSNIEITSVSRIPQSLSSAPASIFVITRDDIRRAGVTTLPEALRLAPNLQAAQVSATEYAISARGFNNSIGNKLLVMIDGRTVYTPLFSGVFWDAQDVLLDDIERIEVLSGPGASIWGLNAVNGVINVITRSADRTQSSVLNVGAGNFERTASFRYGGELGEDRYYRVYGKYTTVDNTRNVSGADLPDAWADAQIGFRADWARDTDSFTVQGDAYHGEADDRPLNNLEIDGLNLIARWDRTLPGGSNLRVQTYYDHRERSDLPSFEEEVDIVDIEAHHSVSMEKHQVVWGAGYRYARDDVSNSPIVAFLPANRNLHWTNLFAQDTLSITSDVSLVFGGKLETNQYTDTEFLPSIRLGWNPPGSGLVWGALSRAARAPSRLDRELFIPGVSPFQIAGGPDFQSEISNVLEVGYRAEPSDRLSYSITAFRHEHDKLRSVEPSPAGPSVLSNKIDGTTHGIEGWASFQGSERWRLSGGFLSLRQDLRRKPDSLDPTGPRSLGNDPELQLLLRSAITIAERHELDILLRHVGKLPDPEVPAYTAVDARLGFSFGDSMVLSITLRNMFDSHHAEFGTAATRAEYERHAFVALEWRLP